MDESVERASYFLSCSLICFLLPRLPRFELAKVQLACLGAIETLTRGNNRANRATLIGAGSVGLLENALSQFASDPEVVSQGLRALVEIVLGGTDEPAEPLHLAAKATTKVATEHGENEGSHTNVVADEDSPAATPFSLPHLILDRGHAAVDADTPLPGEGSIFVGPAVVAADVCRAVETVLAVLDCDPRTASSAFAALERLIVNLGMAGLADGTGLRSEGCIISQPCQSDTTAMSIRNSTGIPEGKIDEGTANARGLLQLAKVRCAVKRALKIVGRNDVDLARAGGKILTLLTVARGRTLAQ